VKTAESASDGSPRFELVAGFRRRAAYHWLRDHGDDYGMIDAVVVTGDKLTLQLVENIQRSDLTAAERERGVWQMCQNGLLQKEVAAELSKSDAWVSKQIAARRVRRTAEAAGADTGGIETHALCAIQTAEAEVIPALVKRIALEGGTVEAARRVMEEYRRCHAPPAAEPAPPPEADEPPTAEAPQTEPPKPQPFSGEKRGAADEAESRANAPLPRAAPHNRQPWMHDPDKPPVRHKMVDVNDILDEIYDYIQTLADGSEKRETAWDIIALIHKRIDTNG
jgi:ParB-like chromosome segregation protein Spo0J